MRNKPTKRALLASALAVMLCVTMLVGTTLAWFTDDVTAGRNTIQSGNLDVVLEYWDGNSYEEVDSDTKLFDDAALWEPGYTEVAYLKVSNAGSLALKYQLSAVVFEEILGKTKDNDEIKLSDYLVFKVVEDEINPDTYTREEAKAAAADGNKLGMNYRSGIETLNADAADVDYLALIIYMPETVGNEANHNGTDIPSLKLGINLYATQATVEDDSFDNQYDKDATWLGVLPESLGETTLEIVPNNDTRTGTITINSPEDLVYLNKLAKEWVDLYAKNGGASVTDYRNGAGVAYYYHSGWDIELAADLDMSNLPMDSVSITYWGSFDGNGHTISNVVLKDGQPSLFINGAKAIDNLTVKNITVNAPGVLRVGAVAGNGAMTNVHVVNATVSGGKYVGGICGQGSSFINCSIKDSTVTGSDKTVGGLVGYSIGDPGAASVTGNTVENVTVTGAYNVGGLLGQSQNETVQGNTVKNVTVKSTTALPAGASSNEVRAAQLAARSGFDNTTIGTNTVENVTVIKVENAASAAELTEAINEGANSITLAAGTYKLPEAVKNKDLTISGTADTKIDVTSGLTYINGSRITFEGVTIQSVPAGAGYSNGLADAAYTVFNDCVIEGTLGLDYSCEFNNCVFNIEGNYYNVWTWGAGTATFNGCTFNCDGKALLVYANVLDNGTTHQTVKINDCEFNDNGDDTVTGKAAIEITNTYTPIRTYDVFINNTTVNGFAQTVPGAGDFNAAYGSVDGSNIGTNVWGNKCKLPSTQINVVIDGVDVY